MPQEFVMNSITNGPGFFGKLPSNGDFVTRRLPRIPFLNTWDEWLQQAMAKSREQLKDSWLNIYLTSPIWRFTLSSGLCGDNAWAGLLMPSVDKVGRYFPLTIAIELNNTVHPLQLMEDATDWFQDAEDVALSALEDDLKLEQFDRRVESLGVPHISNPAIQTLSIVNRTTPLLLDIPSANEISSTFPALVKLLLDSTYKNYSLWWTHGSDHVKPRLIVNPGLPSRDSFTAYLDGNWNQWGSTQGPDNNDLLSLDPT